MTHENCGIYSSFQSIGIKPGNDTFLSWFDANQVKCKDNF
jgi:hypothetical protein